MIKNILLIALSSFSLIVAQPQWAKGIVWYQIFPERFYNGDVKNDPGPEKVFRDRTVPEFWSLHKWTSSWFEYAKWEKNLGGPLRNHYYQRRFGGDLQGIINKLDYIKSLGIGAIYMNPIFESISLHKYDGSTYHHIDVEFGPEPDKDKSIIASEIPLNLSTWKNTSADSLFFLLIKEVHKRGMKIVIDGVFNHTGTEFWAFKDIVKNGKKSPFKDWYIIKKWDNPATAKNEFDYKGWWNSRSMPEFNRTKNDLFPGPKAYIFNAVKKWMDPNGDGNPEDGVDGWRLDVARDVPLGFWKDWSAHVKSINPNAIIIGELWELSPDFVGKNSPFDALMNYNFAFGVNDFFIADKNRITVTELIKRLKVIDDTYPVENLFLLQNLVSSHDTERILSMIKNPDRAYDRDGNEDNKNYDPSKPSENDINKLKMILAFQLTYRGSPMIYYGDEVGMWGADDPHDRKPMLWEEFKYDDEIIDSTSGFSKGYGVYSVAPDMDLLKFYSKMLAIHNSKIALKTGSLNFIYTNDEKSSFAFEREFENNKVIAVFNNGKDDDAFYTVVKGNDLIIKDLIIDQTITSVNLNNGKSKLQITIPARSFKLIEIINNKK